MIKFLVYSLILRFVMGIMAILSNLVTLGLLILVVSIQIGYEIPIELLRDKAWSSFASLQQAAIDHANVYLQEYMKEISTQSRSIDTQSF